VRRPRRAGRCPRAQNSRREQERHRVHQEQLARSHHGEQQPAEGEAAHERGLGKDPQRGPGEQPQAAGQCAGQVCAARRVEDRRHRPEQDDQAQQRPDRQPGHEHQGDDGRAEQVAGNEQPAYGEAVG